LNSFLPQPHSKPGNQLDTGADNI